MAPVVSACTEKNRKGKRNMQGYTSANTSINRTKLPAVYRRVKITAPVVFDYGCGKYTEHIKEYLRSEYGAVLLPFDPFNQPRDVNSQSRKYVTNCMDYALPVDVICSNVLNVIDSEPSVKTIAWNIQNIVNKTGGTGYITVYEGDRTGNGRQTGPDQYQRNEPLRNYLKWFNNATIKNNVIIVKGE